MTTSSRPACPCWVEIDTRALEENYRLLRSLAPENAACVAIVKANAYGHSLALCAPAAVRAGAEWLGVTSAPEAVETRTIAPTARILAIGGVLPGWGSAIVANRITPSVWTAAQAEELDAAARTASLAPASFPVHLEIDTGMSRQGVSLTNPGELAGLAARFSADSPLKIEAVMTHFYASDESGHRKSGEQLKRLETALEILREANAEAFAKIEFLSAGASAALLGGEAGAIASLAEKFGLRPMLRAGLALYGVAPQMIPPQAENTAAKLQSVLSWKSRVVSLRDVPVGAEIGYNGTFTATEPMRLALIPAGYADGINRRLGNHFSLLVRGQRAPLAGRVSMDHVVLDVTEIAGVQTGDEVVVLGSQGSESITAQEIADATGTIPWEVFTSIAARVERIEI